MSRTHVRDLSGPAIISASLITLHVTVITITPSPLLPRYMKGLRTFFFEKSSSKKLKFTSF